ncbi:hypothetical protein NQD34_016649 [Periophthalmus magnuspinnatus]|nr:hypothetical protein NQD34_016649 [Periophthalmus magnuspinnatus]
MLSSLGLRRERSPSYGPPPPKVFIQSTNESEIVTTQTTRTQEMFTPKTVEDEVQMQKKTSPPRPLPFVQSVTRTISPKDATIDIQTEMITQFSGQEVTDEPQLEEMQAQELPTKTKQLQEVVQPSPIAQADYKQEETTEMLHEDVEGHEKGLVEQIAVKKTMTAQELKARKAQAMRNRPWLQKTLSDGQKSQGTDREMTRQQAIPEKMPKEHQKPPHPVRPMQNVTQPEPQLQAPVQSQNTQGQTMQGTVSQVGHIETQVHPLAHTPQMVTQGAAEMPGIWGQASPSSPVRSPSPQHVQLRSHPQTWGPVRPPSPKIPTQNQPRIQGTSPERGAMPSQPPTMPQQAPIRAPSPDRSTMQGRIAQDTQMYPQSLQSRPAVQSQMPSLPQPITQPCVQTMGPPIRGASPERGAMQGRMVQDSQVHSQVLQNQPPQHFGQQQLPSQPIQPQQPLQQPMVQSSQMQVWMPYRGQSPRPIQPPQTNPPYPNTYPQQWGQDQQGMQPPRQPIPQQFPQPAPQMQNYQQWGGQQGYNMGYNQQWGQEQMRPASPMPYGFNIQPPQQTWAQQPNMQGPPPPYSQSQQYPLYQAPLPPPVYPQQQQQSLPMQQKVPPYQQPPQVNVQLETKVRSELTVQPAKPEQIQLRFSEGPERLDTKSMPEIGMLPKVNTELATQASSQVPLKGQLQKEALQPVIKAPTKLETLPKVEMEWPMKTDEKTQTVQAPMSQGISKPESTSQKKDEGETASPVVPIKLESQPKPLRQVKPHTITLTPTKPESTTQPRSQVQSEIPTSPQAKSSVASSPMSPVQAKPQASKTLVNIITQHDVDSPESCDLPPVLAQAPPQAYTEAYLKAQALARNGFEEAKHCLQEHIMEAINVFVEDKQALAEQATAKEEMLRTLEPELLEEFLRAAKGMEAFCTPAQLREMELFTQSVRAQWEALNAEITAFLQHLRFEVTRKAFNAAVSECERLLSSDQPQLCFSAEGSFAQAGSRLSALKSLCETLSPEDAHRLAQTQLRECETRLAAIQRQYSGEQEANLQETRIPVAFTEDVTAPKDLPKPIEKPQPSPEVSLKAAPAEKREVEKQVSVEEEVSKKEALEKYENSKRLLQTQLAKIEQSFKDVLSDSVSLKGLHTRLQELQFLRQETEALWSDFISQSALLPPSPGVEQERAELQEQWRQQQQSLQSRGSSLGAALRQIDSTENHMVDFTDRLDRFLRQPKDISGFTLANTNILKDIKELDGNIQSELEQLSRLDPDSSDLDPRDSFPLSREVEAHRTSLDQLRQQVQKSEAAARALDRFLMSLRTVDEDITGVQSALFTDPTEGRSKLSLIRQSIDSLKNKAPQLDVLLQGARLTVTQEGVPASCLDMVSALLRKLEEVDGSLSNQQQQSQTENQSKSAGLRKRALLSELRKLQDTVEAQGLKEPTLPALQQRLRALSDLDSQLQTLLPEFQSLTEVQDSQGALDEALQDEVQQQWDDTKRALSSRRQQCSGLIDLLKKFQSCRGQLRSTLQKAEQTFSEQASYMGKDNLHKSITKVGEIKEELGSLGGPMEELRAVCKQIQSIVKTIPDCNQTSFEAEAESLMDTWLDVTEKTDSYMDNLQVALELWDKQLSLGSEVDSWAGAKLSLFAASHPFHNEQQVFAMRDEINKNEENIEHFHRKSVEIQEMLQSQESPLELQVIETGLRKRMEQVKELFTDCTDVFEELMAVKKHLTEKIEECQSAVENLQSQIIKCDATKPDSETQIQDLCEDLDSQELQAESVLKEVSLVSSVTSPQALEALSVDCTRLREALSRTREMIHLKREERDKGLLKVLQDEKQSFEEWFQDQQLSVNECFENPESTANVETTIQRLTGFLKSTDPERRLDQLRDQVTRGQRQIPDQNLVEISDFIREQQEEVDTFRTHCHNRLLQMEELLSLLHSLQKEHNSFSEWLQMKEKQALEPERLRNLLKELQDANARVTALSDLVGSVRRQGVRGDSLLKDSDNLLQRFKNLETQVQDQVQTQDQTQENLNQFKSKAEETRKWMRELLEPISSVQTIESEPEEVKHKAETILKSKPEGDSKLEDLRFQSQTLLDQDLDKNQRLEVQQRIRDTEESWRFALAQTEDALKTAETQVQTQVQNRAQLDRDLGEFRDQTDSVQTWISEQEDQLQSLRLLPMTERVQVVQNQTLDDSQRRSIEDAAKETEEQWSGVSQAAEKALNAAQSEAAVQRDYEALKDQWEKLQTWIREQKQKVMSVTALETFEERLQLAQVEFCFLTTVDNWLIQG